MIVVEKGRMDLFKKLRKMKTLLIDDDKWIRDSMNLFFESEGCHLTVLESAEEGLEIFRNNDYDIIIADYYLPGMDGIEFFRQIQDSHGNAIKILITAYANDLKARQETYKKIFSNSL